MLIFGCRGKNKDNYYSSEWSKYSNLQVFTAFSREGESKEYVQHIIKQQSNLLADLIQNQNAFVYISGRAKLMP